jgi:hypothetical protein
MKGSPAPFIASVKSIKVLGKIQFWFYRGPEKRNDFPKVTQRQNMAGSFCSELQKWWLVVQASILMAQGLKKGWGRWAGDSKGSHRLSQGGSSPSLLLTPLLREMFLPPGQSRLALQPGYLHHSVFLASPPGTCGHSLCPAWLCPSLGLKEPESTSKKGNQFLPT